MATHSCILAWRIPWTKEPRRLQSMGSQSSDKTEQLKREKERETLQISVLFVNWLSSLKFFSVARNKIFFFSSEIVELDINVGSRCSSSRHNKYTISQLKMISQH